MTDYSRTIVRSCAMALLVFLWSSANAQVMWNLKGGVMSHSYETGDSYLWDEGRSSGIDWMAGLEMEIPLSSKLNIETGLRYRNKYMLAKPHLDDNYGSMSEYTWEDFIRHSEYEENDNFIDGRASLLELPLRLTYKQQLGRHFMLHVGAGPYASYIFGDQFQDEKNKFQVGLEPSVVLNWKCLSLGATYNVPCFYKGYDDKNPYGLMLTLGIRFKPKVWNYVGATLLTILSAGAAVAAVWPQNDYSSYDYSDYSSSDGGSSSRHSKGSTTSSGMTGADQQNYNILRNTYNDWANKLLAMKNHNYPYQDGFTKSQKSEAQSAMKSIRRKAKQNFGKEIPYNSIEDW